MRFSSCFGNQSPSHRDTRLSPHPGKFQHIFAKNAKMLARKTFENSFAIIVIFFACFGGPLFMRHCSSNLSISSSRSRLQFEVENGLGPSWGLNQSQSKILIPKVFPLSGIETWSQKSQVSEISNLIQSLMRFFQSDCFEFC